LPDERRGPVALLLALDPPQLLAAPGIQSDQIGFLLIVVDDEQLAVVQGGRAAGAPAHARLARLPLLLPEFLAVPVEAGDADVAEAGPDALAVGDGRLGGGAVLDVPGGLRLARERLARPEDLAGAGVEAVDQPAVLAGRHLAVEVVDVQALLRLVALGVAGG